MQKLITLAKNKHHLQKCFNIVYKIHQAVCEWAVDYFVPSKLAIFENSNQND